MLGGEARDRVAGFWRAIGLVPPAEADHLATLLGLYAELRERCEEETEPLRRSALDRASCALLWEHLVPWVPLYTQKMRAIGDEFYRAWAELLERGRCVRRRMNTPQRHCCRCICAKPRHLQILGKRARSRLSQRFLHRCAADSSSYEMTSRARRVSSAWVYVRASDGSFSSLCSRRNASPFWTGWKQKRYRRHRA
jgi:hypothetical protein